ncbi:MAG: helix-turn-helix transcriptional regulator [Spirochaetes bacterium]|nr:helix-turn-helix transcriptional regulator [Spirochaetota bacterium]
MRDELPVYFAHPYKIIAAAHVASRYAVKEVMHHGHTASLLFVIEGHLDLDLGGKHLAMGPSEAFLAGPDTFEPLTLSHGTDAEFYLLQFARSEVPEDFPRHVLRVPEHVAIRNPARLKHLFLMLVEAMRDPAGSRLILHHLVVLMLCDMASSSLVTCEVRTRADGLESLASRVDAYIAAHYHEPIGTPDVARECRYNPDYLERAYRAERHRSIREAIHLRRIKEARAQLLLQRSRGIAEIASLCGFSDVGHFRQVFKRAVNMTPREFRSLHTDRMGWLPPARTA